MHLHTCLGLAAITALLVGCNDPTPLPNAQIPIPEAAPVPTGPVSGSLQWAAEGAWRSPRDVARNQWRHPVETLEFCGLKPTQNVIEVWPGGGWYTQILAPWLKENDGHYSAALLDPDTSERAKMLNASFMRAFGDTERYGEITTRVLSKTSDSLAPKNSVDMVLTFRNVHSWMARGMAAKAFADFYEALKPGGILCVVEHRLPDAREQDPLARSGYVQRTLVRGLAEDVGFTFEAQSDINANPDDTADHPFGVWTLPPVRRSAASGQSPAEDFDRARYDAIGESNRMTVRFRKPANTPVESPDAP